MRFYINKNCTVLKFDEDSQLKDFPLSKYISNGELNLDVLKKVRNFIEQHIQKRLEPKTVYDCTKINSHPGINKLEDLPWCNTRSYDFDSTKMNTDEIIKVDF